METFAEWLARLMRQKHLTPKELSRRSGISNSYIGRILKGEHGDIQVDTIVKLAKGLNMDAHEVFAAATGLPVREANGIDPLSLLDAMQRLIGDSVAFILIRQVLNLSSDERQALSDYLGHFNPPAKSKGKSFKKVQPGKK